MPGALVVVHRRQVSGKGCLIDPVLAVVVSQVEIAGQAAFQAKELRKLGREVLKQCSDTLLPLREELRQLWLNTSMSREHLTAELAAWCHRAEASGIAALQEFSIMLRTAKA